MKTILQKRGGWENRDLSFQGTFGEKSIKKGESPFKPDWGHCKQKYQTRGNLFGRMWRVGGKGVVE